MTIDVAIIGAGVSGLAAAFELERAGHRVVVLERQARPGGKALSERLPGGFLMEHGPSTISHVAQTMCEVGTALGLDAQRLELGPQVRQRYLVRGGAIKGIPVHPFGFLTARYLSLPAKLRLMGEVLVKPGRGEDEETIAAFVARRFGPEFADRVIDPLVGGLYAGCADQLSVSAVFPRLVEMERQYGSVSRAAFRKRLQGGRMPGRRLYSWRDGVGALPAALAAALKPGTVRGGVVVRRIEPGPAGFRIDLGRAGSVSVPAVVIATPAHVTAELMAHLDRNAAAAAAEIPAPPLAVAYLGYRREQVAHPLDGLGFLAPRSEGLRVSGSLFASSMFEGRAPEGHVALSAYVGGARAPELGRLPREELLALVRDELADLLGARGAPVVTGVRHWNAGIPQYTIGHADRLARLAAAGADRPGLFLTGNYLRGPSVADCVDLGCQTAGAVQAFLTASDRTTGGAGQRQVSASFPRSRAM